MLAKQKLFYLKTFLILAILGLVGGLLFEISFGNPQKSKWLYVFQKYYLKREINWPKNYSGVWNEWDENGDVMVSTQVKDGVMDGEQLIWSIWESTPKYLYEKQLYKKGELHGKQEHFAFNGSLISITTWENGIKNGWNIVYYDNYKVKYKREYKNNILDGAYIGYYEDGTKKMEGNFKNNQAIGEWYFLESNGKIHSKLNLEAKNIEDKAELQAILLLEYALGMD